MNARRGLVFVIVLAVPLQVSAQTSGGRHRWEVTGAAGYFTGASLGTADASLRTNSPTPQSYPLFTTQSDFAGALLGEARVGFGLTSRIGLEGRLGYSRPTLETSVSADAEGAAPITIVERVDQYVIDAGVVVNIDELRVGGLVPFAAGGAGYLRQLHEGLTVIEQGQVYHLGGGVRRDFFARNHGVVKVVGLRADARLYFLSGGISLDDRVTRHGSFTTGLFLKF